MPGTLRTVLTVSGMLLAALTGPAQAGQEGTLMAVKTASLYDFTVDDIDGQPVSLAQYRGKVLLVVNTASFCGNTPQYADLQAMYEQYKERGLEILAFPANNFGQQEPGTNQEIKSFCFTKYSLTFPLFSKISVKGADKHPLYQYLTEQSPFPGEVEWNFQKYLVDRSGNVVGRFHHRTKPLAPEVVKEVERVLAAK
ncbi:glutathione peroxidase [Nitrospira moscoviensis]|uniref:Glutathione peroxidase n=1 Tax=Nitrospira moscoviensis TaxID=42253 RepID=A0A0K2GAD2_NITMO|nr:redoxin domain-containing protein [Nitrospira moscoviensis]ALA57562.1 Glutathione peroxidase [Nitrospira moscoviensis]